MDYETGNNLDYYINTTFQKNKLCSFIVSYNENNSFPGSIYNQRVNFAKQILATDLDIDIYGNNWEYSGITDPRIKGTLKNKKDGLLDYKYSIAIENCTEEGYFTEKLTDCILTDTIPIYFGCPNIKEYFPDVVELSNLSDTTRLKTILDNKNQSSTIKKTDLAVKFNLNVAITKYLKLIT
jgi:hypothetical protein